MRVLEIRSERSAGCFLDLRCELIESQIARAEEARNQQSPSGTSNRFKLIPDAGMKSVILNMISLTVVTIAEIVPDNTDLRVAGAGIVIGWHNQLEIQGLEGAVLAKIISARSVELPFL